ncbi:peptidylprolyl isomerase [Paenibacillus thalictri]|uniref:peptidylprolyl isomerase n=1 Tax=Paenibacillus thalictri TaxID=2527873 RepID=UPI001034858A|nr:peptidylprolyl isomerase [Paenibacillus thalictri]
MKQLLQRLRIDASLAAISRCKDDLTIECWAESLGLTADTAALQTAVTRFRRANGLLTSAQASQWLTNHGMELEDLASLFRPQVLKESIAQHLVSDDEVKRYFLECAHQYDRAEISTIATDEYGIAQELLFRVEEGSDFHALAREYSSDAETAKSGGYAGLIGRADLSPEMAAAVFNATKGSLLGPFEQRRKYNLVLVEALYPAELSEEIAVDIRQQIFQYKLEDYQRTLNIQEEVWRLGEG